MRLSSLLLTPLLIGFLISNAAAGTVLDRVKARGVVRCGSVERPGLAVLDSQGRWSGLEVDCCQAVSAAVLGSPDHTVYNRYKTPGDFDAVRNQQDDIYFLTGSEIVEQRLAGKVAPGPTVFVESLNVMAAAKSAARHVADLCGESICFMIGSPAERSLNAYFYALHKNFFRRAFSEEGEMVDTYQVQNCRAIAGEITTLASVRLDPGVNRLSGRILPEALEAFPVMATTGTGDAQWSSLVAWTMYTLISSERPDTRWYSGGAGAIPISAEELGLDNGWQDRVLKAVGNYGDIFDRNLGKSSLLKIERGLNANRVQGGLFLGPFLE